MEYKTRISWWTFACVLVAYFVLAGFLVTTKRPWTDEGWFVGPAVDLATHGRFGTPLLDPRGSHLSMARPEVILKGINQHTYWAMPLHMLLLAGWGKLFGFTLFAMRTPAVLWGAIALLSLWIVVFRLYGNPAAATLAAAILACEFGFLDSAADCRMDMMCAALGFAGLAVYLSQRDRHFARAIVWSHSLAAAALFTHPNGTFAAASLLFCALWLDRAKVTTRVTLLAVVPYAIGMACWGAYILQAPSDFVAQFGANTAARGSALMAPLRGIYDEIGIRHLEHHFLPEWGGATARVRVVGLILFAAGIGGAIAFKELRRHPGCQLLLWLTVLRFLMLSVGASLKLPYYLVHILPFYAGLAGIVAWHVWTSHGRLLRVAVVAQLGLYFAVQLAIWWHLIAVTRGYQNKYLPAVEYVQSILGPGDLVDGSAELGFALGFFNPRLEDDLWIGRWSGKKPTILVVDQWEYGQCFTVGKPAIPYRDYVQSSLRHDFELVRQLDGYQIYRRKGTDESRRVGIRSRPSAPRTAKLEDSRNTGARKPQVRYS